MMKIKWIYSVVIATFIFYGVRVYACNLPDGTTVANLTATFTTGSNEIIGNTPNVKVQLLVNGVESGNPVDIETCPLSSQKDGESVSLTYADGVGSGCTLVQKYTIYSECAEKYHGTKVAAFGQPSLTEMNKKCDDIVDSASSSAQVVLDAVYANLIAAIDNNFPVQVTVFGHDWTVAGSAALEAKLSTLVSEVTSAIEAKIVTFKSDVSTKIGTTVTTLEGKLGQIMGPTATLDAVYTYRNYNRATGSPGWSVGTFNLTKDGITGQANVEIKGTVGASAAIGLGVSADAEYTASIDINGAVNLIPGNMRWNYQTRPDNARATFPYSYRWTLGGSVGAGLGVIVTAGSSLTGTIPISQEIVFDSVTADTVNTLPVLCGE